jgi:hypothetical protein
MIRVIGLRRCVRPALNATGLPSPGRTLGHGALFCFAVPGRLAAEHCHSGSTPREARLPGSTAIASLSLARSVRVVELIRHPARRQELGTAAWKLAEVNFGVASIGQVLQSTYAPVARKG